jgi:rhodanese-related sulfurtransferase
MYVERNVLEWRFDPRSTSRLEHASYASRVIVLCQEGYTSSLAADALVRLGIRRATDVVGGFAAWQEAGLPVAERPASRAS